MEIHSSSLASIPPGYKNRQKNDETQTINIVEKNLDRHQNRSLTLPSPDEADKSTNAKIYQDLTDKINHQNQPVNSRTSKALNSYIQENITSLKNERSELISSIDYFV